MRVAMECCNGNYLALMMSQDAAKCFQLSLYSHPGIEGGGERGEGDAVKGQCFDCPVEDKGERRQTLLMSGHELNTSIKREHVCWPGL